MANMKQETSLSAAVYLRLPGPLLAAVKALATEGRRPMNTQVIMLLEQALKTQEERPRRAPSA